MGHASSTSTSPKPTGIWGLYHRTPLYVRIIIALVFGVGVGLAMGPDAAIFRPISDIVLRLLGILATPLIFCALAHSLLTAQVTGKSFAKLLVLLLTNTAVAILIGLAVANLVQPGRWTSSDGPTKANATLEKIIESDKAPENDKREGKRDVLQGIPKSVLEPFVLNDILPVILIALAFGAALRIVRGHQQAEGETGYKIIEQTLDTAFRCVMVMLHWVFHLVPFAVFAVVARLVGEEGFDPFKRLAGLVVAVLLALALQATYYLVRVRLGSWVRPKDFLKGGSDALAMAFSTASSTATLPVTFECMVKKIGVREENATMGVMVGGSLNNDGTALYEAMAALFVSQYIGQHLGFGDQLVVALMAVFASVGAAGIPEAGLVTMVLVFKAVHLPLDMIFMLLMVDWFLDRCRTAINVMGDMTVTCILDGKVRHEPPKFPSDD